LFIFSTLLFLYRTASSCSVKNAMLSVGHWVWRIS